MSPHDSLDALIPRLRAGDPEAEFLLFQRYSGRLIGLARAHLDSAIRQKTSPEDVVQSVFKSFYLRRAAGHIELESGAGLWSLLVTLTLRKCGKKVRYFHQQARDVRRETGTLPGATEVPSDWEALSSEPTPYEAAVLAETVEQMMRDLDERQRQILERRLQGYTVPEISSQVGRTEHTVEGVLRRIRGRLQRQRDEENQAS
jgi:RNA polymerase sigma-70 factor (ECF subfamily)